MSINYSERIPNNVDLSSDRRLQRALEAWQPNYLQWWRDLGPDGSLDYDVYLRTAISTDANGWAHFGYVKMPDYRWGIFLADREADRRIAFGDEKGKPAWQEVPGEHRATLRRLIVTQGDTEPASVEQQRLLGKIAPSLYDLRNLFRSMSGRPPSVGDGLPAARLFRPRRAQEADAAAPFRRSHKPRILAPSTRRRRTGSASSCSPTSPTATASTGCLARRSASIRWHAPVASC